MAVTTRAGSRQPPVAALRLDAQGGAIDRVANAQTSWTNRHGLLVRLFDCEGHQGLGEVSPLPGHSSDSLAACRSELTRLSASDVAVPLTSTGMLDIASLTASLAPVTNPAARFGLETALLDLAAQQQSIPLWKLLQHAYRADLSPTSIPLNAVCTVPDPGLALAEIDRAYRDGIRCIKIKLGRAAEAENELLRAVRARYGDELTLRGDANRAWSLEQAQRRLDELLEFRLAYLEEPVIDPMQHWERLSNHRVPLALDESLAAPPPPPWIEALLAQERIAALVLKPMLLGGHLASLRYAQIAARHRVKIVVSHLFDGPIALAAYAQLALAIATTQACGLARHSGLKAWPICDIDYLHADHIEVSECPGLAVTI